MPRYKMRPETSTRYNQRTEHRVADSAPQRLASLVPDVFGQALRTRASLMIPPVLLGRPAFGSTAAVLRRIRRLASPSPVRAARGATAAFTEVHELHGQFGKHRIRSVARHARYSPEHLLQRRASEDTIRTEACHLIALHIPDRQCSPAAEPAPAPELLTTLRRAFREWPRGSAVRVGDSNDHGSVTFRVSRVSRSQ